MRRMINSSGAFGGSLVFATAILMLYPQVDFGQQTPPSAPVTVVNQTQNPVPTVVTGTANISGDVNAKQAGTWTVNVGNVATVEAQQSGAWKFAIDSLQNFVQDTGANTKLDTVNGHLTNIDAATSQLKFDGSGNLKTVPQGTQNVNVIGGSLSATPTLASRAEVIAVVSQLDPQADKLYDLTSSIKASTIVINTNDDIYVTLVPDFQVSGGFAGILLGKISGGQLLVINLTQQIPMSHIRVFNPALLTHATFDINVIGN